MQRVLAGFSNLRLKDWGLCFFTAVDQGSLSAPRGCPQGPASQHDSLLFKVRRRISLTSAKMETSTAQGNHRNDYPVMFTSPTHTQEEGLYRMWTGEERDFWKPSRNSANHTLQRAHQLSIPLLPALWLSFAGPPAPHKQGYAAHRIVVSNKSANTWTVFDTWNNKCFLLPLPLQAGTPS